MKIAIDTGVVGSGHNVRGIGVHTSELLNSIKKLTSKDFSIDAVDFSKTDLSKYDLVHYTSFHPHFLTLPRTKPAKKVVVTIHDLIPLIYPDHYPPGIKGRLRFLEQKRRLRSVDAIITISETSKKDICRFLGVDPNIVFVVHLAQKNIFKTLGNGSWRNQLKKNYHLPDKYILYVGDINYNKNIPSLIKAAKLAKVPLVIVGKNALKIEELADSGHVEHIHLKEIVSDLKEVRRLGFVPEEDISGIYNLASLYVQPSYYEGFGLPLLEAMACGVPVVASRIQAHVEVAGEAVHYSSHDAQSLAKKITEVMSDSKLMSKLVGLGSKVIKNYSWEKVARGTIEVYKKCGEI